MRRLTQGYEIYELFEILRLIYEILTLIPPNLLPDDGPDLKDKKKKKPQRTPSLLPSDIPPAVQPFGEPNTPLASIENQSAEGELSKALARLNSRRK